MSGDGTCRVRSSSAERGVPLQRCIVYGPVCSRRLGRSLGINLLPTAFKVCPFECIYCQYGRTDVKTMTPRADWLPTVREVQRTLSAALESGEMGTIDAMTFSGNGEPTLHPHFDEIVTAVIRIRDQLAPTTPVAVLSSAARVDDPGIRATLNRLDRVVLKLDAGDERTFRAINRPITEVRFEALLRGLAQVENLTVQTMLVKGAWENASPGPIARLIDALREIRPREVQLYTLDRAPAEEYVEPVPEKRLDEVGKRLREEAGIPVRVYS